MSNDDHDYPGRIPLKGIKRGSRIRVLFARNPPDAFSDCIRFPTFHPTIECPFPGWCVEILNYLTEYLDLKIEPVILKNVVGELNWGNYVNGSWDGVLGFIENQTVDTACLYYQRTGLRDKHFAFSYPITNVKPTYVVHSRPEEISSNIWNAFAPYAKSTWITMLMVLILQTIYCMFVSSVEVKMKRRREFRPYQIIWKFIRLQLYQPDRFDFSTKAGNFTILLFTIIQCRLLLDMYQTLLLSALLQPTPKNPFTDAKDMIKMIASQRYHLITNYIGNWYFEELSNSNASHYRSLRIAVESNPVYVSSSVSNALDKVVQGSYIFPIQQDSLAMQYAKHRCNLVYIKEGLPEISSHFVFKNGSKFIHAFNEAIILNLDFIRRTFVKYFETGFKIGDNIPDCEEETDSHSKRQDGILRLEPLGIVSMFGVMFVMILGLLFSFIAFILELYYSWQLKMFKLKLRTRRAMAEPIHLMALARLAGPEIQNALSLQFEKPTLPEIQAHFGEFYM